MNRPYKNNRSSKSFKESITRYNPYNPISISISKKQEKKLTDGSRGARRPLLERSRRSGRRRPALRGCKLCALWWRRARALRIGGGGGRPAASSSRRPRAPWRPVPSTAAVSRALHGRRRPAASCSCTPRQPAPRQPAVARVPPRPAAARGLLCAVRSARGQLLARSAAARSAAASGGSRASAAGGSSRPAERYAVDGGPRPAARASKTERGIR